MKRLIFSNDDHHGTWSILIMSELRTLAYDDNPLICIRDGGSSLQLNIPTILGTISSGELGT